MKRFFYDISLFMIIILVGTNIKTEDVYVNKANELKQFEHTIKDKKIESNKTRQVLNQIHDNKASSLAKNTSVIIKNGIKYSVKIVTLIFDEITK